MVHLLHLWSTIYICGLPFIFVVHLLHLWFTIYIYGPKDMHIYIHALAMQRVCMQYACRYAELQACIFELAIQQIWDLDVYIYTCAIAINIKYIFIHFCRASWELKRICSRCIQLSTAKCGQIHLVKSYSRAFFKNQQITFKYQSSWKFLSSNTI